MPAAHRDLNLLGFFIRGGALGQFRFVFMLVCLEVGAGAGSGCTGVSARAQRPFHALDPRVGRLCGENKELGLAKP